MKFTIASGVPEALRAHAVDAAPREACGLLIGQPGTVSHAVPTPNIAAHPERGFEIAPATLLRLHREARGTGEQVVGHYHSHPNGIAEPSRTDTARAAEDGQLWIIVAGGAITGWTFDAGHFAPVELD